MVPLLILVLNFVILLISLCCGACGKCGRKCLKCTRCFVCIVALLGFAVLGFGLYGNEVVKTALAGLNCTGPVDGKTQMEQIVEQVGLYRWAVTLGGHSFLIIWFIASVFATCTKFRCMLVT